MSESNERDVGFDGLIEEATGEDGFDWEADDSEVDSSDERLSVLRFEVGDRWFAAPIEFVREIVSELEVTPVPGAPKHVRGVSVLRRQVVGVLNLYQWLDPVADRQDREAGRVIIVETGPYSVGIETTASSGMDEWPKQVLDRSRIPESINTRTRRYALGIRLNEGQAVVLLDIPKLLEDAAV